MEKKSALILGATGRTGSSIVDGLLQSGNFDVMAGIRPSSASKPEVAALRSRGVNIRIIDLESWTIDQLAEALKGVNTVISTLSFDQIPRQKLLADACRAAGVQRFVPDDWASACVRGQIIIHDQKREIHDYVKKIGLGYTFIDIGWWMDFIAPTEPAENNAPKLLNLLKMCCGSGDIKTAVTDRRDIGKFVARIIVDERTLNHYVFCWTQEVTQNEAFALIERISGRKANPGSISVEEITKKAKEAENIFEKVLAQYTYSLWVRGDNTVENAKKDEYGGALDARELYPDIGKELRSLEDIIKEYYLS